MKASSKRHTQARLKVKSCTQRRSIIGYGIFYGESTPHILGKMDQAKKNPCGSRIRITHYWNSIKLDQSTSTVAEKMTHLSRSGMSEGTFLVLCFCNWALSLFAKERKWPNVREMNPGPKVWIGQYLFFHAGSLSFLWHFVWLWVSDLFKNVHLF